jgi:hypothetical protein
MAESQEQLVILDGDRADTARAEIEGVAPVTQMLPPRLLLILAAPGVPERVRRIPGVVEIFDRPSVVPASDLSPPERVFVDAWATRNISKTRRGEGLNWGETGFEPPDAADGVAKRDGNEEPFEG